MTSRQSGLAAMLLVLATTCVIAGEPEPYKTLRRGCAGLDNSFRCARAIEETQSKAEAGKRFERRGSRLTIKTRIGRVTLDDDLRDDDQGYRYSYIAFLPRLRLHVVHLQMHEGGAFTLVSQSSGQTIQANGFPVASPDSQRFASYSNGGEAGYDPNRVEIWRVRDGQFTQELAHEDEAARWAPTGLRWRNNKSVHVQGNCRQQTGELRACFLTMRLRADSWAIANDG